MRPAHGGDVYGFELKFGRPPLDFSANISPCGLPSEVRDACIAALDRAGDYPDPLCRELAGAIAVHEGIDKACVLCGNGSADLLFRLGSAFSPARALVCAPTFAEYEQAVCAYRGSIEAYALDAGKGFRIDEGFVERISQEHDLVFICQPNNPTGLAAPRELVLEALKACEQAGAYLVVDECFVDLLDEPGSFTVAPQVLAHPRLVVLKAFTKLYGMPGLRLGYALCSDGELLERMSEVSQPWAVSCVAQAAGIAALGCEDYVRRERELVRQERKWLISQLLKRGISAQGMANFLFFQLDEGGALSKDMRQCGVLVRDCSNYRSLAPGAYRIAVRSRRDNEAFLAALDACLGNAAFKCR